MIFIFDLGSLRGLNRIFQKIPVTQCERNMVARNKGQFLSLWQENSKSWVWQWLCHCISKQGSAWPFGVSLRGREV